MLYLFIRNDFRHDGRITAPFFILGIVIYSLTGLTKASTLSLLGCLVAYKAFFYKARNRRPIFSNDLLIFLVLGLLSLAAYIKIGFEHRHNVGERYQPTAQQSQHAPSGDAGLVLYGKPAGVPS